MTTRYIFLRCPDCGGDAKPVDAGWKGLQCRSCGRKLLEFVGCEAEALLKRLVREYEEREERAWRVGGRY